MKLSDPKYLKIYVWLVLFFSFMETLFFVPGDLSSRLILAVVSLTSIFFGLVAAGFVLGGNLIFAMAANSIIGVKPLTHIKSFVVLTYWFGIIGSAILILIYPIHGGHDDAFSMAPIGVGLALGAKWVLYRYDIDEQKSA